MVMSAGGAEHSPLTSAENRPSGSRSTRPRRRGYNLENGDENAAKERALSFIPRSSRCWSAP